MKKFITIQYLVLLVKAFVVEDGYKAS